jgi:hypothetical protein
VVFEGDEIFVEGDICLKGEYVKGGRLSVNPKIFEANFNVFHASTVHKVQGAIQ